MSENVPHPHDSLFKADFGNEKAVAGFLEKGLPKNILQIIDLNSLKVTNESFVSEDDKTSCSDRIYSIRLRNRSEAAYVVIECVFKADSYSKFGRADRGVALYHRHKQQGHEGFPVKLNVCVARRNNSYSDPTTPSDLSKKYHLVDQNLLDIYDERTRTEFQDKLKQSQYKKILKQCKESEASFYSMLHKYGHLFQRDDIPYMKEAITYILSLDKQDITLEKLKQTVHPKYKDFVISTAKRLKEQGIR